MSVFTSEMFLIHLGLFCVKDGPSYLEFSRSTWESHVALEEQGSIFYGLSRKGFPYVGAVGSIFMLMIPLDLHSLSDLMLPLPFSNILDNKTFE